MSDIDTNPHIGSSFDDFLVEEGIYDEVNEVAVKRVVAYQLAQIMKMSRINKSVLARRMKTSRQQVVRLLEEDDANVTIKTLTRAAHAVGKELVIDFK